MDRLVKIVLSAGSLKYSSVCIDLYVLTVNDRSVGTYQTSRRLVAAAVLIVLYRSLRLMSGYTELLLIL